ncbi:MAG TPA: hypothetical protein VHR37_06250, partial [Solirubrobacterales bacterium]|nr:hypothetical protein [Solirubrobacterales bacterium]
LEAAINEADRLDLVTPMELREELEARRGQRGVGAIRAVLDRSGFVLTESELERRFLPVAARAGLPTPQTQQVVNGFRVDFFWPDLASSSKLMGFDITGLRSSRREIAFAIRRIRRRD